MLFEGIPRLIDGCLKPAEEIGFGFQFKQSDAEKYAVS